LESIYDACLCRELPQARLAFIRQRRLPIICNGEPVDSDLIADVIVGASLILEINRFRRSIRSTKRNC
jgi:GxxExxY protein